MTLNPRPFEMPPWFADAPKGVFSNEKSLTEKEIQTIIAWVDALLQAAHSKAIGPLSFEIPPHKVNYRVGGAKRSRRTRWF